MSAVASIISLVLFLGFVTSGLQKVRFNPMASQSASHLEFSKSAYQRIGILEIAGGIGLLVGLAAKGSSFLAVINEAAAGGLTVLMFAAVYFHIRKGDNAKLFTPALVFGLLALLELIFRLAA
jgi:uncharacterized membrane protein YphA (DoxX/SURF4 family)